MFAVYNSIVTPLEIAFEPPFAKDTWFTVIDLVLNAFYVADICVNMRTSYINEGGEEIVKPYKIVTNYCKGLFAIDLVSSIPFGVFPDPGIWKVLSILKVIRLLRMRKVIANLETVVEVKALAQIAFLVFLLFVIMHVVGCVWFLVVRDDKVWIPPPDFIEAGNPEIY